MWQGTKRLLLTEYFDDKIELQRLQQLKRFNNNDVDKSIKEKENSIKEFLSMLDKEELKSVILMSLDIE